MAQSSRACVVELETFGGRLAGNSASLQGGQRLLGESLPVVIHRTQDSEADDARASFRAPGGDLEFGLG